MRALRSGDVSVGAQTLREQPRLVQLPQEPGEPPAPELYEFRGRRGLSRYPRIVVYSLFGRLPLGNLVFRTPGVEIIVVTSERGADELPGAATPGSPSSSNRCRRRRPCAARTSACSASTTFAVWLARAG